MGQMQEVIRVYLVNHEFKKIELNTKSLENAINNHIC
jgi:hypothetical protein